MRATTAGWIGLSSALGGAALTLYLLHPGLGSSGVNGPDPVVLVGKIRALSRLETASVDLETTVTGGRGDGWLRTVAGESLVFRGVGEARAGVDLSKLEAEDLWVDTFGVVWLRLPEAEVFDVTLDPERSAVLARDRGWFGKNDAHFESEARRVALLRLRAQAEVVGLEEEAAAGARATLERLLEGLGVEDVRFVIEDRAVAGAS